MGILGVFATDVKSADREFCVLLKIGALDNRHINFRIVDIYEIEWEYLDF